MPQLPILTLNSAPYDMAAVNNFVIDQFLYPVEDPEILSRLQKLHGKEIVTEERYKNICETKQGKPYYRKCVFGFDFDTFDEFLTDAVCEQLIVNQEQTWEYEMSRGASRQEVTGIAVKMKRINGKNVGLVQDLSLLQSTYTDIGHGGDEAKWVAPIIATALRYNLITSKRNIFEPKRNITRAEAFAMVMKSVCMMPLFDNSEENWKKNVYSIASDRGVTIRSWENFAPDTPILRSELVTIVSRAANWAERTGGCDPKPEYCFLEK